MHSDIVRRHLNSSVTDSGEYEVVHLERDEVEGRDHAESMKILATMNETEKSQLQEWRQLQSAPIRSRGRRAPRRHRRPPDREQLQSALIRSRARRSPAG